MKIKPKTQPLPEEFPDSTHCIRQYKAHQIAKLLLDPLATEEQVKYITDDLILATEDPGHHHVESSLDLWRLGKPNLILNALVNHYSNLPHYAVSTLLDYFTRECYEEWVKVDEESFVMAYHNLLRERNLSIEDMHKQYDWMNKSSYGQVPRSNYISSCSQYDSTVVLAERLDCPEEIILALCSDEDSWIRDLASRHVRCPREGRIAATLMGTKW